MIENGNTGNILSSIFTSRFQQKALDETIGPRDLIYFARKVDGRWTRRNVTNMFVNATPISKRIADDYGTSKGTEVSLVFDNSPFPVIYPINQTDGKILRMAVQFHPNVPLTLSVNFPIGGDWIEISDYNNIEHRKIVGIVPISDTDDSLYNIELSTPLDNEYDVDFMEIRYVFAIAESTKTRLDTSDYYNGYIQMNLGFQDQSEYVTLYQGEVTGGSRDPNNTVTLTTQDRVKSLIETQITGRFEVDDRGVASVPTPKGWRNQNNRKATSNQFNISDILNAPNSGTGKISDITYSDDKLNEITLDDEWSVTFNSQSETWHVWGANYGSDNTSGYKGIGGIGSRVWTINETETHGWSFTIDEGHVPFEHGDQFVFYTKPYVDGMCHIVKGHGYEDSPISTLGEKYLNPSYIIDFFVNDVIGIKHEKINVFSGDETNLLVGLDGIRETDLDFRTELRGSFEEGTSAIQVIDDALRAVNGWMYSTHDDHLSVFIYSPFAFGDYSESEIHTDYDHPRTSIRYPNAANPQIEPRVVDSVKNQIVFNYANGSVFVEDTDSQDNFGFFKLDIRGEDLITHSIQSRYEMSENTARNASYRALQRFKDPIFRGTFVGMPGLLLLEIGDIPIVYSRESQFVNKPFWVTGVEIDFVNLIITITGELATQISGKFGFAHGSDTPIASKIWDSTGFIGEQGEERLAFVADDDEQLALFAGADTYSPRVGKPDRWGNFVTDAFIVS